MQAPLLGGLALRYFDGSRSVPSWNRLHPFDRLNGVRTSGSAPGYALGPGSNPYGAAQPSIIRHAISAIPEPGRCHFVDLGCGKGRPPLIATEYGFASITGVEWSKALARIARRNAETIASAHPSRTRVAIVNGDALAYELPPSALVIFAYNPFGQPQMRALVERVEASLRARWRELYVISYNPVWAELFDASPLLERRFAAQIPYDASEIGYGPDDTDAVVIWQERGNPAPRPPGDPAARVRVTVPGMRAEIA